MWWFQGFCQLWRGFQPADIKSESVIWHSRYQVSNDKADFFGRTHLGRLNLISNQAQSYKLPKCIWNLGPMDTKLSRTQGHILWFPSLQLWNYFWTLWHVLYQTVLQMYTSTHHLTWQGRPAVHQRSWLHLHCFQEADAKPTRLSCLDLNGNAYTELAKQSDGMASRQVS